MINLTDTSSVDSVEPRGALIPFLLVAVPCTLIEAALWFLAVPVGFPFSLAFLIHLAIITIAFQCIRWHRKHHWDLRFVTCHTVLGGFLGPLGMAITVMAALMVRLFSSQTLNSKTLLDELLPESEQHPIAETANRLRTGLDRVDAETTPVPFLDVMTFGSMAQKRTVIGVTLRYFSPELTAVLKKGLLDKTNSVRVMAATAMVALEEKYHSKFIALQKELNRFPDELEVQEAYAKHCSNFAFSHILGPDRSAAMRDRAIKVYESLVKTSTHSVHQSVALGRLYVAAGRYQEALTILSPWLPAENIPKAELLNIYGEALLQLGRYSELRTLAKNQLKDAISDSAEVPLALWAQEAKAGL